MDFNNDSNQGFNNNHAYGNNGYGQPNYNQPYGQANYNQPYGQPNYNQYGNGYAQQPMGYAYGQPLPVKSKLAAGLLNILLGDLGIGNFYMGKIGLGVLDIIFCWTGIPGIVGLIRGIMILCESNESFAQKYNVIPDRE